MILRDFSNDRKVNNLSSGLVDHLFELFEIFWVFAEGQSLNLKPSRGLDGRNALLVGDFVDFFEEQIQDRGELCTALVSRHNCFGGTHGNDRVIRKFEADEDEDRSRPSSVSLLFQNLLSGPESLQC